MSGTCTVCPAAHSSSANCCTPDVSPCAWWKSTTSAMVAPVERNGLATVLTTLNGRGGERNPRFRGTVPPHRVALASLVRLDDLDGEGGRAPPPLTVRGHVLTPLLAVPLGH